MPDITLSATAQQSQRFATALGRKMGYTNGNGAPRDATAAEMKEYLKGCGRQVVHEYEAEQDRQSFVPTPWEPT